MATTTDPTILAYLAGVIDSDGYVTAQRQRKPSRVYIAAKVGIAGTRRQPHDLAASIFGGRVTRFQPRNPRHRPQFQWSRNGRGAVQVLEAIGPYLRVKAAQAALALRLQGSLPTATVDELEALVAEIQGLNQHRRRADLDTHPVYAGEGSLLR